MSKLYFYIIHPLVLAGMAIYFWDDFTRLELVLMTVCAVYGVLHQHFEGKFEATIKKAGEALDMADNLEKENAWLSAIVHEGDMLFDACETLDNAVKSARMEDIENALTNLREVKKNYLLKTTGLVKGEANGN